jgi:hypothetical protein
MTFVGSEVWSENTIGIYYFKIHRFEIHSFEIHSFEIIVSCKQSVIHSTDKQILKVVAQ